MNRRFLLAAPAILVYVLGSFLTGCSNNNNNNNNNHNPASVAATSGSGQSATVSGAFANPLVATVTDSSGSGVSGVTVTFTAPSSGASGTFANSSATETDTTNSSGVATSSAFTANATAGAYTVTASVSGVSTPASFSLTNTSGTANSTTYVFYASGMEAGNNNNGGLSYYAVAGAVTIDNSTGNVTGGEEDYNDGSGVTQPTPPFTNGIAINGGSLTVDATGQGTLTLATNSALLGGGINPATGNANPAGTESFGVQFANANHALIMQFDGTATSSGSLDVQSATKSNAASYAFLLSGVDYGYNQFGAGGVYTVGSNSISGIVDINDFGTVAAGQTLTGTSGSPDAFGRGTASVVIGGATTLSLVYYNVGPEVIRLIDMDPGGTAGAGDAAVGSAYGQGSSTTFTASSLGSSVIGLQGDPWGFAYATAGSIATTPTSGTTGGTFTGTVDDNEEGATATAAPFAGTYSVSNSVSSTTWNGYSSLTVTNTSTTPSPFFHVTNLGVYMTDPNLNLLDPNNTGGSLGGALVLDLDSALSGGTGIIIPQTDVAQASFTGTYAFGAQEFFQTAGTVYEFDYLGQSPVASLSGTSDVSDPFAFFAANPALYLTSAVSGTAMADANEGMNGRYTVSPFTLDVVPSDPSDNLSIALYQASGGALLYMDSSSAGSLGFGSFQQQGSLTGIPAKRGPVTKAQRILKHK